MRPIPAFIATTAFLSSVPLSAFSAPGLAVPVEATFEIHVPSNTGIPGLNNVLFVKHGPDGRVWTGARDSFWLKGGVAALDLESGVWQTWANWQTTLPQWNYDVAFAADGSAWVVGDDRVNHIQGDTMTAYTPANSPLVTGPFGDVSIGPDGHVWAANNGLVSTGGGLFEFDGQSWAWHWEPWMENFAGNPAPPTGVIARSNGQVWASFQVVGSGLGLYENGTWTQMIGEPNLIAFAEAPDGTLWAVNGFGTWRLNDRTTSWEQIGTIGSPVIAIDPTTGWLYVRDFNVVYRYDGAAWSFFAQTPGTISSIDVAGNGDVWLAAEVFAGVDVVHHYTAAGELLRRDNSLTTGVPDYLLNGLYCDEAGYMWFISTEYGATRLEPGQNYRNFGARNVGDEVFPFDLGPGQLLAEGVSGVFHDSQGNIWLTGNGAARSHGEDLSQWDLWYWQNSILPSGFLSEIGEDNEGNVYIGGDFVAFKFDGESWSEEIIGNPQQFSPIGFHNGLDGELYAIRINVVYRREGGAFVPVVSLAEGIVKELAVGADGVFWMATAQGLRRWSEGVMTTFTPGNSAMAELNVQDVAVRPDGLVAVSTTQTESLPYDGGLAFFDGESWSAFDYGESALPFYVNDALTFDPDGNLWIATLNWGAVRVIIEPEDPGVPGDADGNGVVNVDDLVAVVLAWGPCPGCPEDLNGDGRVNVDDLVLVVLNWNPAAA